MFSYQFSNGSFEPYPFPEWNEHEEYKDYLNRIGFNIFPLLKWGEEFSISISVYTSNKFDAKFIVDVDFIEHFYKLFVPSFPDLIQLLNQLYPIVQTDHFWNEFEEKGFRK